MRRDAVLYVSGHDPCNAEVFTKEVINNAVKL